MKFGRGGDNQSQTDGQEVIEGTADFTALHQDRSSYRDSRLDLHQTPGALLYFTIAHRNFMMKLGRTLQ